jgi:hypothetical protein
MRKLFLSTLLIAASLSSITYAQTTIADCTAPRLDDQSFSTTANSVSVVWSGSNDDEGCRLCYKVEWKAKSETNWSKAKSCLTYAKRQVINGLTPATDYDTRISVKCCNGKLITGNTICLRTTSSLCNMGAYEPNNKVEEAKAIPNSGTIFAAIERRPDEDWYKFKLVNESAIITLANVLSSNDYNVEVFDAWKRPLSLVPTLNVPCASTAGFRNDKVVTVTMPAGTPAKDFYIKVSATVFAGNYNPMWCYALRISQSGKALLSKDVDNEAVANNIEVFPNPVNDQLSINLGDVETASEATINILDAMGRVVMASQKAVEAGESILNLNVSELNNGLHFVAIRLNDGEVVTRKILVAHEK